MMHHDHHYDYCPLYLTLTLTLAFIIEPFLPSLKHILHVHLITSHLLTPFFLFSTTIIINHHTTTDHHNHNNSVRNEQASYVALRSLLLNALKVQTAETDKVALGKLLLDDTKKSDRGLMALTLRVEERELVQSCLSLVDKWLEQLADVGEAFIPSDSPLATTTTTS